MDLFKFFPADLVEKLWSKIKSYVGNQINALSEVYAAITHSHEAKDVSIADAAGKLEATNVENAIAEIIGMVESSKTDGEVEVTSNTDDTNFLKTYVIKQGGQEKGKINIPKDMVVTSGSCVKVASGKDKSDDSTVELANGTYLKLIIANQTAPVYIPASSLVDVYTGGSNAEIAVSVNDETNVVTATIVAINGSKLVDGSVAKTKLDKAVQDSLDKADSALQSSDIVPMTEEELNAICV